MNFLALDVGNSRIKLMLQQSHELPQIKVFQTEQEAISFLSILNINDFHSIVCDVRNNLSSLLLDKLNQSKKFIFLNHQTRLPISNLYETPETLGYDRIAAVCGGSELFPHSAILVIDAGTAITYDLLNEQKEYLGGAISPGLSIRFKALNEYTGKLPLANFNESILFPGKNTNQCIEFGVIHGLVAEIESIIDYNTEKYSSLTVILTGGDSQNLVKIIKKTIFVEPNLVLIGLINILKYNAL